MVGECHISCVHQLVLASICEDRFSSVVVTKRAYLLILLNGPGSSAGECGALGATVIEAWLHTYFKMVRARKGMWGEGERVRLQLQPFEKCPFTSTHLSLAKPRGTAMPTTQGWEEGKSPRVWKVDGPIPVWQPSPPPCGGSGGWVCSTLYLENSLQASTQDPTLRTVAAPTQFWARFLMFFIGINLKNKWLLSE